jgi:hypothetical protein
MKKYFVTTHQDIPWDIPFKHEIIGVEGFIPREGVGVAASSVISKALDWETAFGAMRGIMAINSILKNQSDDVQVFTGSYRLFLGAETNADWLSPVMQENRIISPEELKENWCNIIATEIPEDVDIMIPAPRLLPDTLLGQFARVHHLDDLMLAVGCAIRAGLLDPISVPAMLNSNTLIPYGNFASRKSLRFNFNEKLWACALDFYKNYYVPRTGYQKRVIDFVFERIASMAIVQMVVERKLRCLSCRNYWISLDGTYKPT